MHILLYYIMHIFISSIYGSINLPQSRFIKPLNKTQHKGENEGTRSGSCEDKSVAGGHSGLSDHHKKVTSIFNHFSLKVFCFVLDLVVLICFHVYLAMELHMSAFWFCALIISCTKTRGAAHLKIPVSHDARYTLYGLFFHVIRSRMFRSLIPSLMMIKLAVHS